MNSNLFDVLVDRNVINGNTEIEARIKKHDLSGVAHMKFTETFYYVAHYVNDNGTGSLIVSDAVQGTGATFDFSDIISIDGMEPRRLASIYSLSENGESLKQGARRGRKPKNRVAA